MRTYEYEEHLVTFEDDDYSIDGYTEIWKPNPETLKIVQLLIDKIQYHKNKTVDLESEKINIDLFKALVVSLLHGVYEPNVSVFYVTRDECELALQMKFKELNLNLDIS